ncbi:MAG: 16S rRNA (adenine(1518)-N(6)/adenine(1519)-N(6))-dimethyltransferase RsmA [Patescibacteria group bacterium]
MKFKYKKHFGQNFLNNKNILNSLIDAANISKKDVILEIGPGMGILTELLAMRAKKVIAVEKDRELVAILKKKFAEVLNVKIIEGDILRIKIDELGLKKRYKIAANIPYYITGKFLRLFLDRNNLEMRSPSPSIMVIMVQKEVAERIVAKDGKESLLSLSVKAYGTPKIIRKVPKGAFMPPPKVDSAIVQISRISDAWFRKNKIKPDVFFAVLKSAFQQKRKTLKKSLSNLLNTHLAVSQPSDGMNEKFTKKRPEELSLDDWAQLWN